MDNQAFRKDLEAQLNRLNGERDEALILVGKKLGAIEYCQSLLNALDEMEGEGNTSPISIEGVEPVEEQAPETDQPNYKAGSSVFRLSGETGGDTQ